MAKTSKAKADADVTSDAKAVTKEAKKAEKKAAKKAEKVQKALEKAQKQEDKRAKVVDPEDRPSAHEGDAVFGDEDFTFSDTLRVDRGFVLADLDPRSTPGYAGDKKSAALDLAEGQSELSDLQERLWANGRDGDGPSVLLVVQGMDTSGKGGIMRHVVGSTDPGGVRYTAFKAPTAEERAHDFLWRIERALPDPGQLGVFDRSQYEDVLVVRVHDLVPRSEWMRRYAQINAFERQALARGITVVKVMLHISSDEQRERLGERLARPDKYYKYNPGDIDERGRWGDYMEAYQAVLAKTSTRGAPWHVVPADRKWYARLAVQQILLEHLRGLDLQWPEATFDVAEEKERLAQS
ncbi:PPK2 family polyphosphate kinase [Arsenicicoccus sp. oral taxon 190]|uniref:PPK2 family polyphosphate kinase n=1 Tax=Arsenicicoccus sp. oral taxon 190 TaxID=1658671 RepID=UPI000679FF55|nr:PPK2 family polyphosphate kinase [Arsenicicoccus sp. oral taxon 190]AKT51783.1 polyphosphate kinase (could be polyphosphate AMP phosphotransferase (pap)) [Arsenicicoccus sp. oral taxon 190]